MLEEDLMTLLDWLVVIVLYYSLGLFASRRNMENLHGERLSLSILFIDFSVNLLLPLQWTLFADHLSSRQWSDRRYVMTSAVFWLPCLLWSLFQWVILMLSIMISLTFFKVFGTPD